MNNLYVKKPIPVEAFCPRKDPWPEWFINGHTRVETQEKNMVIEIDTLEGTMKCSGEDYIIQGVDGELYPCRRDIFLKTYEHYYPTFTMTLEIEEDN